MMFAKKDKPSENRNGINLPVVGRLFRLAQGNSSELALNTGQGPVITDNQNIPGFGQNNKRFGRLVFFLIVLAPSLLAALYYGAYASDQFSVETRLIVRTVGIAEISDDEGGGTSAVGSRSLTQDAHVVTSYIKSPEIVQRLQDQIDLVALFGKSNIDVFSRLNKSPTREELFRYWKKQIFTYVDGPSGIIVFTIRAFEPDDALLISQTVLAEVRTMIDRLSERAKRDLVSRAELDVEKTINTYGQTLESLRRYQDEVGILNPIASAEAVGELMSSLITRKLETEARIAVLKSSGVKNSSTLQQLTELQKSLEAQIEQQRSSLANSSGTNGSLSETLVNFSKLETDRLVAEKHFEAASRNLDTAKSTALRRTSYVAVFSQPSRPEKSTYPKRLNVWFLITLGALIMWGTILLIWAAIEDHRR